MKRYSLPTVLLLIALSVSVTMGSRTALAQAGAKVSSQQLAALRLASANLMRGYSDLLATPPDVKGDTSKLEDHMKAAMNFLHLVDPAALQTAPANIPVADKGETRVQILSAVKAHLVKAQTAIQSAKVTNTNVQQALANITVAQSDLSQVK